MLDHVTLLKHQHQQCHIIQCTTTTTTMQQQLPPLDNQQLWSLQHPDLGEYARGRVLESWEWLKWALGEFFFFVLYYFILMDIVFIGCIYDLGKREMVRTMGRIKNGPNDVRHVVWAHRWVFSSSFILLYINGYFIVFIGCITIYAKGRWLEQWGEL